MDLIFSKATAVELIITSLGIYKFPYATLTIIGILGIGKILNEFSKTSSSKLNTSKMNAAIYHPNENGNFIIFLSLKAIKF